MIKNIVIIDIIKGLTSARVKPFFILKNNTMNKQNDLVSRQFDKLYKTALEVTVAYNKEYIPLNALFELIKAAKMKKNKSLGNFPESYNNMLDVLYKVSKSHCDENNLSKKLPMVVFKEFINLIKKGLNK